MKATFKRKQRWLLLAVLIALPVALLGVLAERRTWLLRTYHVSKGLCSVQFSPDGEQFVTDHSGPDGADILNRNVWNLQSGALQRTISIAQRERRIEGKVEARTEVGRLIAVARLNGRLDLYDVQTDKVRRTLRAPIKDFITPVKINSSPRSDFLCVIYEDTYGSLSSKGPERILLWDLKAARLRHTFWAEGWYITSLALAPEGTFLAFTSDDRRTQIWNLKTGKRFPSLEHVVSGYENISTFSPDGALMTTVTTTFAHDDPVRRIGLWNVHSATLKRTLLCPDKPLSITFSPDGTLLATMYEHAKKYRTIVWDVQSGRQLRVLSTLHPQVVPPAFAPDSRALAVGSEDNTVTVWRLR